MPNSPVCWAPQKEDHAAGAYIFDVEVAGEKLPTDFVSKFVCIIGNNIPNLSGTFFFVCTAPISRVPPPYVINLYAILYNTVHLCYDAVHTITMSIREQSLKGLLSKCDGIR